MVRVALLSLLLAVLIVSPSQEHPTDGSTSSSCVSDFHETLNKSLNKEQCVESYPIVDCCLIKAVGDILLGGHVKTDIYDIQSPCRPRIFSGNSRARCDMDSGNGGWLVIQRRVEGGIVDFNRGWNDYEDGFGDLEGEFWYGLKDIHCLTSNASMELRMDMEDESGNKISWTYQEFRVEGPENKYRLHIGGGEGTPGTRDYMPHSNNKYFSTKDRDNDVFNGLNCAVAYKGGWWFYRVGDTCSFTSPNGQHDSSAAGWFRVTSHTTGNWVYYPNFEMKIRPKSCYFSQIAQMQAAYCKK